MTLGSCGVDPVWSEVELLLEQWQTGHRLLPARCVCEWGLWDGLVRQWQDGDARLFEPL